MRINQETQVEGWEIKDLSRKEHKVLMEAVRDKSELEVAEQCLTDCLLYKGEAPTEENLEDLGMHAIGTLLQKIAELYFPKPSGQKEK